MYKAVLKYNCAMLALVLMRSLLYKSPVEGAHSFPAKDHSENRSSG